MVIWNPIIHLDYINAKPVNWQRKLITKIKNNSFFPLKNMLGWNWAGLIINKRKYLWWIVINEKKYMTLLYYICLDYWPALTESIFQNQNVNNGIMTTNSNYKRHWAQNSERDWWDLSLPLGGLKLFMVFSFVCPN